MMDHIKYLKEIGAKGGAASRGTPSAKIRASKAARARWANHAPSEVREAFRDAIEAFVGWNDGEDEPTVEYKGEQITLRAACGLVWNCKDILPRGDYDWLRDTKVQPKSQTYASSARAMLEAIKETTP